MGNKDRISPEDAALFRKSIGEVDPVEHDRAELDAPRPTARARFRRADDRAALRESLEAGDPADSETGEELLFQRERVPRKTMRRLRRGRIPVRDQLDLHGMTRKAALDLTRAFIQEAVANRHECVCIVHGKGHGSGSSGPVLKHMLNQSLRNHDRVLAFSSALPPDGGTGAVYVLLDIER